MTQTSRVFPRKWTKLVNRSTWTPGPWDAEPEDREQWEDPRTGLPCFANRCDLGGWAAYVGVDPDHPAYGRELEDLPGHRGVNFFGLTSEIHYIAPPPDSGDAIDENDPTAIIDIIRMPDLLWFFGFDAMHGFDIVPGMQSLMVRMGRPDKPGRRAEYRTLAYVKNSCAELAEALMTDKRLWT